MMTKSHSNRALATKNFRLSQNYSPQPRDELDNKHTFYIGPNVQACRCRTQVTGYVRKLKCNLLFLLFLLFLLLARYVP